MSVRRPPAQFLQDIALGQLQEGEEGSPLYRTGEKETCK